MSNYDRTISVSEEYLDNLKTRIIKTCKAKGNGEYTKVSNAELGIVARYFIEENRVIRHDIGNVERLIWIKK